MKHPSPSPARRWFVLSAGLGWALLSEAAVRSTRGKRTATDKGPAETHPERDRRLQRECRGKPNAGACEGYAS